MRWLAILAVLVPLVSFVSPCSASSPADLSTLIQHAQTKGLATHPYWMALLHYHRKLGGADGGVVSDIISPGFFLSPLGATDPDAELVATLTAFFADPGDSPDSHAQCRLIARYKWLRKSLDWGSLTPPDVTCARFQEWNWHGQIESLSLVFATGYFGNPASFYGHILVKFNTRIEISSTDLLHQSMNYGATVPVHEHALVYVAKGLFGGYEGGFSHEQFYRINHVYVENEMRDMWEYELALTPEEVDRIVSHGWELLGNRFVYYFLKENCAYRMAELLNLVIEPPLLPDELPWAIPATVFENLSAVKRNGAPLVKTIRRVRSRQNNFYARFSVLNELLKNQLTTLVSNGLEFDDPEYRKLAEQDKIAIVDALLDYYEFRLIAEKDAALGKEKRKLLLERAELPGASLSETENAFDTAPPNEGPKPGMVRVGMLHNSQFGSGLELHFRPAYYDFLGLDAGRLANSSLVMFDLKTVYVDGRFSLRRLDVVNAETLNVSRTHLPGEGGLAWKLKIGFESQDLSCRGCVVFGVTGGIGKAVAITDNAVAYAMLELLAQTVRQDNGTLGATALVGMAGTPAANWKSRISLGGHTYVNGSRSHYPVIRWENRFGSHRDWDLRFAYEEKVAREWQLAVSFYW
jgi:hypothetical protein